MLRTWISSFLTILFISHLGYAAVSASDLCVSSGSGAPGSMVSVSVVGNFGAATNSIQFNLQFDQNLLTVSGVTAGSASSGWLMVKNANTAGTVVVGMFNTGSSASGISGPQQQIAVINFTVNNPPGDTATSSALTLSRVNFNGTSVTQLTNGVFTLDVPPVNYTLTVNVSGNGTVSESPNSATYQAGSQVVLTAIPLSGYQFSGWSGGASGSTNPLTLTMNADTSVIANFTVQNQAVVITASAGTGGAISPSGSVNVNYGANQAFTVTPAAGYDINQVSVDGAPVTLTDNSYTLSDVIASHSIVASFSLQTETITASAGVGGSISPSGNVSVNYGASQVFTVKPDSGYSVDQIVVDGAAVGLTNNTYMLSNVTQAHTIAASFKQNVVAAPPTSALTLQITSPANGLLTNDRRPIVAYITNGTVISMQLTNTKTGAVRKIKPVIYSGNNLPSLSDGNYILQLISQNTLGNQMTAQVSFTVDTVPPTLVITAPVKGAVVSSATPVLSYTTNGTITSMTLDKKVIAPVASGKKLLSMANGKHRLELVSKDEAGNETKKQISFTIKQF